MRPDTKLTPRQLAAFFTPWHYAGVRMAWEGRWVLIQPIPRTTVKPRPTPAPSSLPATTRRPVAVSSATPHAFPAAELPGGPQAQVDPGRGSPADVALVGGGIPPTATPAPTSDAATRAADVGPLTVAFIAVLGAIALVTVGAIATARNGSGSGSRRTRRSRLD